MRAEGCDESLAGGGSLSGGSGFAPCADVSRAPSAANQRAVAPTGPATAWCASLASPLVSGTERTLPVAGSPRGSSLPAPAPRPDAPAPMGRHHRCAPAAGSWPVRTHRCWSARRGSPAAPPRQNSCRLDRTPVFGVHEGSRRLCSCGRRSAWWATRSVVHGKRAGARSASSTNAQPCRCLQAPARCRVFHPGGEEREASWHDTDKHSKTERWAGCCHRTAPRPTSWRVRSA